MFNIFKGSAPKQLEIGGFEGAITVEKKETILHAALKQGIPFPHSCRVGGCATCKCKLVSGKVKELTESAYILSEAELDQGYILACQAVPKTDVKIVVDHLNLSGPNHGVITSQGTLSAIHKLTHDIVHVVIELDQSLEYTAGQYALLSVPGVTNEGRSYSFASAPVEGGNKAISFYIREVPGGLVSTWMQQQAHIGKPVQIAGPFGDFYLRDSQQPMLCIAGGSGLAPVKALLEQAKLSQCVRDVVFLFGARTQSDLYCLEELKQLQSEWIGGGFKFIPILSAEPEKSDWAGLRGMVTDFIPKHVQPASQVYMCGPPAMLDAAEAALVKQGISNNNIFSDKFLDKSFLNTA